MLSLRKLAVFLGVVLSSKIFAADPYVVVGSAYELKSSKLVYRELISKLDENNNIQVNYARPSGVTFARKTLNFNTEIFQPSMSLTDDRDDEFVSANFDAGKLMLTHRLKGDSRTKTLYDTAKLVIDAGLDAFIQQNWNRLTAGKKIDVEIADARFVGTEKYVLKEIDASESPLAYKGADKALKFFKMEVANRLASLMTEPTYFAYLPDGMFMLRYQGTANIDNDKGEPWLVRIEYQYF